MCVRCRTGGLQSPHERHARFSHLPSTLASFFKPKNAPSAQAAASSSRSTRNAKKQAVSGTASIAQNNRRTKGKQSNPIRLSDDEVNALIVKPGTRQPRESTTILFPSLENFVPSPALLFTAKPLLAATLDWNLQKGERVAKVKIYRVFAPEPECHIQLRRAVQIPYYLSCRPPDAISPTSTLRSDAAAPHDTSSPAVCLPSPSPAHPREAQLQETVQQDARLAWDVVEDDWINVGDLKATQRMWVVLRGGTVYGGLEHDQANICLYVGLKSAGMWESVQSEGNIRVRTRIRRPCSLLAVGWWYYLAPPRSTRNAKKHGTASVVKFFGDKTIPPRLLSPFFENDHARLPRALEITAFKTTAEFTRLTKNHVINLNIPYDVVGRELIKRLSRHVTPEGTITAISSYLPPYIQPMLVLADLQGLLKKPKDPDVEEKDKAKWVKEKLEMRWYYLAPPQS